MKSVLNTAFYIKAERLLACVVTVAKESATVTKAKDITSGCSADMRYNPIEDFPDEITNNSEMSKLT